MFARTKRHKYVWTLLREHFGNLPPEEVVTASRTFPDRVRPDLQHALEDLARDRHPPLKTIGIHRPHTYGTAKIAELMERGRGAALVGPLQFVEVDIGDEEPVRCLRDTLWFMEHDGFRFTLLLSEASSHFGDKPGLQVEIAAPADERAETLARGTFRFLEQEVARARSYRGKVLSLEQTHQYSGTESGILVHKLRPVSKDQIILPAQTLEMLERNVFGFFAQRSDLLRLGMSVRKGLLFHGAPGTGKTHTVHYLAAQLPEHTVLLITAEQAGLFQQYIALARLLQPSIVVIEDADLLGRDRSARGGACDEVLLNQLLNEMDGLRQEAEILFILTTNRPEMLEPALAARPGRIDQAIEYPLPDAESRGRLVALYGAELVIPEAILADIVQRTENMSPAFIKELMRRAAQFSLARNANGEISADDTRGALDEMLVEGGALNASLLGVHEQPNAS